MKKNNIDTPQNEPFTMFKARRNYEDVIEVTILRKTEKKVYFRMQHDHRKEDSQLIESTSHKYFATKDEALQYLLDRLYSMLDTYLNYRIPSLRKSIANLESQLSSNITNVGYGAVLKCKCEMPAKMHGKDICWRCKRSLSLS